MDPFRLFPNLFKFTQFKCGQYHVTGLTWWKRDEALEMLRVDSLHLADGGHEAHDVLLRVVLSDGDAAVCVQWQRVLHQHSVEQTRHVQTH